MQEVRPAPAPGTLVQARGQRWYVRAARPADHGALVVLDAAEAVNPQRSLTLLLPFDRLERVAEGPPARRRRQTVVGAAMAALSGIRAAHRLWTARSARIDLLPWQLAPALAVLGGATRLLLADAVGLGKTVQAGLVLAELRARGLVERALILAPATLRQDWAAELSGRFGLPVTVLDLPAMLEVERSRRVGANPWSGAPVVVSSLDLVKRTDVLLAVEREPLDLLVVDEVHHATPGTDRYAAVSRLARQVPWVVLVSATPHSGDRAAYRALTTIGEVGAPPDECLRVFRRSHADVRVAVVRRTHVLRVTPSADERRLQAAVLDYVRALCRSPAGPADAVRLLAGVLARRATSSPLAIQRTLMRRLARLRGAGPAPAGTPLSLPWDELDEEAGDSVVSAPGLADVEAERGYVLELLRLAEAAGARWSKGLRLLRLVSAIDEPLIVFSEFRDSLDACRAVLEPTTSVVCLHGEVDARERRARIGAFVEGRARVLLATDVAGEGLNLQGPSRVVITLEWPWNPLRIEQRVGRVHRLGQTRAVHAVHLTARQSYEDTVVARVLGRAARATADLSEAAGRSESTVAAEVLDLPRSASQPGPRVPPLHVPHEAATCEAEWVARLRRWAALGRQLRQGAPVWARPRRGTGTTRIVAVVEVRRTAAGSLSSCDVVPVDVRLRSAPAHRRQWRLVCRRLAADHRIREAAIDATSAGRGDGSWNAVRSRLAAIRAARRSRRRRSVQPSLFDRRALREARGLESADLGWDAWQAQLEQRLPEGREPSIATTRLVALLPIGEASP